MVFDSLLEQKDRVRSLFAEVHFLLMRKMRYGIGNCIHCEDAELLQAQVEVIDWRMDREDEDDES